MATKKIIYPNTYGGFGLKYYMEIISYKDNNKYQVILDNKIIPNDRQVYEYDNKEAALQKYEELKEKVLNKIMEKAEELGEEVKFITYTVGFDRFKNLSEIGEHTFFDDYESALDNYNILCANNYAILGKAVVYNNKIFRLHILKRNFQL